MKTQDDFNKINNQKINPQEMNKEFQNLGRKRERYLNGTSGQELEGIILFICSLWTRQWKS